MKPSERIEQIVDNMRSKNPFAYPYDSDIQVAVTHISAIQQYLDEEYEEKERAFQNELELPKDIKSEDIVIDEEDSRIITNIWQTPGCVISL